MTQLANSIEAVSGARAACAQAMMAIDRTLGTEATSVTVKVGTKKDEEGGDEVDLEETYTLPKYLIDSSSHHGLKPKREEKVSKFATVSNQKRQRPACSFLSLFLSISLSIPLFLSPSPSGHC